jgi:hypothetical protein
MAIEQHPTWGHKIELWSAAMAEAKGELEEVAKAGHAPIFYSQLNRKITSVSFEPDGHDFHGLLGQLSEESDEEGKGMISALVVHKEDGRPGKGFFTLASALGRNVSDPDKCWSEELKHVYRAFA